jgi:hypothetical protein
MRRKPTVSVFADGLIDVGGDGKPELDSKASARRALPSLRALQPAARRAQGSTAAAGGGAKPFCASNRPTGRRAANLYPTTKAIEAEDPDYILMTIGANPILANTLFGLGPAACALEADLVGGYRECVEEAFEGVHLERKLKSLYKNLVENTQATIYLMQYHLSIPPRRSPTASPRSPTPPHFDIGVSLEPVYPSSSMCSYLEYGVDGPSVQPTPTQDELEVSHPLSFCEGPKSG